MITKIDYCKELSSFLFELSEKFDNELHENFIAINTLDENLKFIEEKGVKQAFFEDDYEYCLFHNLYNEDKVFNVFHYTSANNLLNILDSGKIHLNSLTGMNDKSEINLVNNYMRDLPKACYDQNSIYYHNFHNIFCFTSKHDDLMQWRLYGDNTKGAILEFEIQNHMMPNRNILVSKVYYDLEVFSVIKKWLKHSKETHGVHFSFKMIDYWKFFHKNEAYRDECEIRLLIKNSHGDNHMSFEEHFKQNKFGIIAPYIEINCIDSDILKIKSVTLGSKFIEAELNQYQIQYLMLRKYNKYIEIKHSLIDYYR